MKKARDLGRDDQADNFGDSLKDDLKAYEYGEKDSPSGQGLFDYDAGNELGLWDLRSHDGVYNDHVDRSAPKDNYYHAGPFYEDTFPDGVKYYDFNKERNADPRYRKAKAELDRLNGLKYK